MGLTKARIFYNNNFGYLLYAPVDIIKSPLHTHAMPLQKLDKDVGYKELGEAILYDIERSKTTSPITKEEATEPPAFQATGIKGWKAFCNKFECVNVLQWANKNCYEIEKHNKDKDGTYSPHPTLLATVPFNVSAEEIGKIVMDNIKIPTVVIGNERHRFETLYESKVSYSKIPDFLEDCEDGHTDAYQVYAHEESEDTYIMFVVDSGYKDFTKASIKQKWEQWFGKIKRFNFYELNNGKIKAKAVCEDKIIKSVFFNDGDFKLEVMYQIQIDEVDEQEVLEAFEEIIKSVRVTPIKRKK